MNNANSKSESYFHDYQPYLIGVAYRMLGSVADAEEVVQETFLRYETSGEGPLTRPKAWLTRVCTRLCLDRMKRLSSKLEVYPGQWLPEPFVEADDRAAIDETLSIALLIGLQALGSKERAVFLLHDIFDYQFAEVAATLELSEASCRQLAVRARRKIRESRSKRLADSDELHEIINVFLRAIRDGDAESLRAVLSDDVRIYADGGGKVTTVHYPLIGRAKVHTFLMRIFRPYRNGKLMRTSVRRLNGAPGLIVEPEGDATSVFQLEMENGTIKSIFIQRNPEKLRRL